MNSTDLNVDDHRLSISGLNKSYSAPVLKNVTLSIPRGEIHALVGENGAGKTTLVNILAGLTPRDSGDLWLDGDDYEPHNVREATRARVSFAAQELSIIETLSAAENVLLRNLPARLSVIDRKRLHRDAKRLIDLVGLQGIPPDMPAGKLSLSERQLLELAKALAINCRVLLLDEPTAALTAPQAAHVHDLMRATAASGTSIIYISHRLEDVLQVADTVSVLRDGEVVASGPTSTTTVAELVEQMTGRTQPGKQTRDAEARTAAPLLRAEALATKDLPIPVNLECRPGEIVGIAGLAGAGKSELLQALFGLVRPVNGCVIRHTDSGDVRISCANDAVLNGVGYLGEDRQATGIFHGQSVLTNIMVPGRADCWSKLGVVDRRLEQRAATKIRDNIDIRCASLEQDIGQLSGGNQQKTLIARWLHVGSEVLLLDEPTRGVDVRTKHAIYDLLFELQSEGKGVVVASSEIEELMTICHRILVLSRGELVREFIRGNWTEREILGAAFSAHGTMSPGIESASMHRS